jgi:3-deoxy-7-phosphoheptulonate synthase
MSPLAAAAAGGGGGGASDGGKAVAAAEVEAATAAAAPAAGAAATPSASAAGSSSSAQGAVSTPSKAPSAGAAGLGTPPPPAAAAQPPQPTHYNLGTHFLWIGDRTRQLDHAHVEYFRGIANPIGVKAGPTSDPAELVRVIARLWPNPREAPGKIVIITRLGAGGVLKALPRLIAAVQEAAFSSPVVWVCDPMHGNTTVTASGYKTREFDDILAELK